MSVQVQNTPMDDFTAQSLERPASEGSGSNYDNGLENGYDVDIFGLPSFFRRDVTEPAPSTSDPKASLFINRHLAMKSMYECNETLKSGYQSAYGEDFSELPCFLRQISEPAPSMIPQMSSLFKQVQSGEKKGALESQLMNDYGLSLPEPPGLPTKRNMAEPAPKWQASPNSGALSNHHAGVPGPLLDASVNDHDLVDQFVRQVSEESFAGFAAGSFCRQETGGSFVGGSFCRQETEQVWPAWSATVPAPISVADMLSASRERDEANATGLGAIGALAPGQWPAKEPEADAHAAAGAGVADTGAGNPSFKDMARSFLLPAMQNAAMQYAWMSNANGVPNASTSPAQKEPTTPPPGADAPTQGAQANLPRRRRRKVPSLIDLAAKEQHKQNRLQRKNDKPKTTPVTTPKAAGTGAGAGAGERKPKPGAAGVAGVPRFCGYCGGNLQASFKFCQFCGADVGSVVAAHAASG